MNVGIVLGWKFNNTPGIETVGDEITSWPGELGDIPTGAQIEAWTEEYTSKLEVPTVVDMRQARLALLEAGILSGVEAAIGALPSPQKEAAQIEWEFSAVVRRDSPLVQMLSGSLGLNETALDALFVAAGNL